MATSLSAYWVKFFKGAGFPQDVATKHAVVFSNNRIKPDMLPDLDKPSLKEMGITLMGDMIAILRYAKKVVEETTCERFLVDSEDAPLAPKISTKPVPKKVEDCGGNKTILPTVSKINSVKKVMKPLSVTGKKAVTAKKSISLSQNSSDTVSQKQTAVKRKLRTEESSYRDNEDDWNMVGKKRVKTTTTTTTTTTSDNGGDDNDNTVEYIGASKVSSLTTRTVKKPIEQKRTVFDRLGDSSVTSTTNLIDTAPTFNITGVGKDVFKRSSSVFKRLGDIDDKKDHVTTAGILKNGSSGSITVNDSPGILKSRLPPSARTSIITTKRVAPKTAGTMHADHEASKRTLGANASRILKLRKETASDRSPTANDRLVKPVVTSGKLASERLVPIPAKARLGATTAAKQVTFSKVTMITRVKKADVFSRLGV